MTDSKPEELKEVILESGIKVKPVYGPEDLKDLDFEKDVGQPGAFPFTRGIHPLMYRKRPWTMRQYSGFAGAKETNQGLEAQLAALGAPMKIDRFDAVQLLEVLRVCRSSLSLSEAGRRLFDHSRRQRKSVNDSDRIRKYLAKFGIDWREVIGVKIK